MSQIRLLKKIICIDTGLLLKQFTPVASRISESWQIEKMQFKETSLFMIL